MKLPRIEIPSLQNWSCHGCSDCCRGQLLITVTPEERASLFQLAIPDVGRVQLRDNSIAALEGYSRLRSMTKRLWAATSTEDVLTAALEQIADWFDGALLVRSTHRPESAPWEHRGVDDKQERSTAAKVIRDMRELAPEWCDAAHFYPRLENAGDLGARTSGRSRYSEQTTKYGPAMELLGGSPCVTPGCDRVPVS